MVLFLLLAVLAARPLAAAQAQVECYATHDGGTTLYHTTDNAGALRDALTAAAPGGTVWVAGICQGTIAEGGDTQVARITDNVTLVGYQYTGSWSYDPAAYAIIDAQGAGRVLVTANGAQVTLRNLHIVNGLTTDSGGGLYADGIATVENTIFEHNAGGNMGGALIGYDSLTLNNTEFISNTTSGLYGGAVAVRGSGNDLLSMTSVTFSNNRCTHTNGCFGGALSALNAVTMTDTLFVDNHTTGGGFDSGGGAIHSSVASLTINNSRFEGNTTAATGGAIYVQGPLVLANSELVDNVAALDGGAVWTSGTSFIAGSRLENNRSGNYPYRGGAVYNTGDLTVSLSEFYSNTGSSGAAIFNASASLLSLTDSTMSWNQGNMTFGSGGGVRNEGTFDVSDSTFSYNRASSGGALGNAGTMDVQQIVATQNEARFGGAVSQSSGNATITGAILNNNRSIGVPNQFEEPGGGALMISFGQMTVSDSEFNDNTARHRGGAIYNSASFSTDLVIENSEINGNSAGFGGGLYLRHDTTVQASTIFDNEASNTFDPAAGEGGAVVVTGPADVVMTNNFVAGNTATAGSDTIYFDNSGQTAGTLDAFHNTLVGVGAGTAVQTNGELVGYAVALTNVIISGYETGIHTVGLTDTVAVNGVLWYDVDTPTTGPGITVANVASGDPAFVNAAAYNFHILPRSAAFDRGVATAVNVDIDGDARPQGTAPDLGADELFFAEPGLGDLVWVDTNGNGIQEAGEPGLAGVTVNLRSGAGSLIDTTTTAVDGFYFFPNVAAGSYQLEFVAPSGYSFSPPNAGGDDTVDSDAHPVTGRTAVFTLPSGIADLTWDAGLSTGLPDLVVTKTAEPAVAPAGSLVLYTIHFSNAGVGVAEDVVVADVLPDELTVISISTSGVPMTPTPGVETSWNVGDLPAGSEGTIVIIARVNDGVAAGTDVVNDATIAGSSEEATLTNNEASVTVEVTVGSYDIYLPLMFK